MNDTSKSTEDRAFAEEQLKLAVAENGLKQAEVTRLNLIVQEITQELNYQKDRYKEYSKKLQEAADVRAAAELAE
jgi:hypothetical protein